MLLRCLCKYQIKTKRERIFECILVHVNHPCMQVGEKLASPMQAGIKNELSREESQEVKILKKKLACSSLYFVIFLCDCMIHVCISVCQCVCENVRDEGVAQCYHHPSTKSSKN